LIHFECDYADGVHPRILERLTQTNEEQAPGYGADIHCERAAGYIRKCCGKEDAAVHFLVGGTQANLTVIGALLKPYQGVISSEWGHIEEHETGAIEATGHKVMILPSADGKINAAQVEGLCQDHAHDENHEHRVQPGMVYISHPTENGTLYTKRELEEIAGACRKWGIPLYMDGARLGYGLAVTAAAGARREDWPSLPDIADLCDLFYIGGTKVGAMFGEALVITNKAYQEDFRYHIKQRGALLAKGRMLGIQFEVLFEDGLYLQAASHAVAMADLIRQACVQRGYPFLYETSANQIFPIFPERVIRELQRKYVILIRTGTGEVKGEPCAAVRICTSWATSEANARQLAADIVST